MKQSPRIGIGMGDIGIGLGMGDIGIGYRFHTRFFNVISVLYICIKIDMNPVPISYRYIGIGSV